jgi:hypothetical protein
VSEVVGLETALDRIISLQKWNKLWNSESHARNSGNIGSLASQMDINQVETLVKIEAKIKAEIKSDNEKFEVKVLSCPAWIPTKPGQRPFKKIS